MCTCLLRDRFSRPKQISQLVGYLSTSVACRDEESRKLHNTMSVTRHGKYLSRLLHAFQSNQLYESRFLAYVFTSIDSYNSRCQDRNRCDGIIKFLTKKKKKKKPVSLKRWSNVVITNRSRPQGSTKRQKTEVLTSAKMAVTAYQSDLTSSSNCLTGKTNARGRSGGVSNGGWRRWTEQCCQSPYSKGAGNPFKGNKCYSKPRDNRRVYEDRRAA